jgi:methionyl-tRNA synthetase
MHFGNDANFSEENLVARLNADLANDLGNLFSRVLAMASRYCGGVVPAPATDTDLESDLKNLSRECLANFQSLFDACRFSQALESLWEFVRALNKYVDVAAPWAMSKRGDTERLNTVLYTLLEGMRKTALHLWPVMPGKAEDMYRLLGLALRPDTARLPLEGEKFGLLAAGLSLPPSVPLFPRVD